MLVLNNEMCVSSCTGVIPEFDSIDKTNPNCVVIGDAAENFSYQNVNEAFRVLIGLEKPLLFSLGKGCAYIRLPSLHYLFQASYEVYNGFTDLD